LYAGTPDSAFLGPSTGEIKRNSLQDCGATLGSVRNRYCLGDAEREDALRILRGPGARVQVNFLARPLGRLGPVCGFDLRIRGGSA